MFPTFLELAERSHVCQRLFQCLSETFGLRYEMDEITDVEFEFEICSETDLEVGVISIMSGAEMETEAGHDVEEGATAMDDHPYCLNQHHHHKKHQEY